MDRKKVKSSNIASIGYNAESEILEIEFKDSAVYQYADVPKKVHTALMKAKSPGGYLFKNVKGIFESERVS